jgi:hypothetical protein
MRRPRPALGRRATRNIYIYIFPQEIYIYFFFFFFSCNIHIYMYITGDDDVPGDVLKLMGEGGLKIMTKLFNTICETGEWPKDFTEVTMITLKRKPQATKYSDHRTIRLITHTAKIVAKVLRRKIERKIEDVLGEDQFAFRRGRGTGDAIGMLRII